MADNNNDMLEKIKERLDIVELVGEYVYLKKSGSNHLGLCPFHGEKTPSFTVSESKQIFHCFGCGTGGDAITFVMKRENLDFIEAMKFLAEKYNIPWEDSNNPENSDFKSVFYDINRAAAHFFHQNLMKNKNALGYLTSREISYEITRRFGLGFASGSWDDLLKNLKEKNFTEADIEKTGLIGIRRDTSGFYDKFRNRIIFPIVDTRSRVIGFGGRVLDKSLPKYLNSPDTVVFNKGNHLYGLNIISKNQSRKRILLVEGYMDVISLNSSGVDYAVASLGTALTETQGKLLKRYGEEIYICYDSDSAGVKASIRAIDVLQKLDIEPRIVILPDGMDPDDYIKANNLAAFEKKVSESLNFMDFKVYILKEKFDLNNPEGKIKFTQEAARLIGSLKSPIQQDVYIDKISADIGITREAIASEIKGKRQFKFTSVPPVKTTATVIEPARIKAENDLIGLMLVGKDIFNRISEDIKLEDFGDTDCRFCYKLIRDRYGTTDRVDVEIILKELEFDTGSIERFEKLLRGKPKYTPSNIERVVGDLIKTIRLDQLEIERKVLMTRISELDESGSNQYSFADLAKKLTEINKKINLIS